MPNNLPNYDANFYGTGIDPSKGFNSASDRSVYEKARVAYNLSQEPESTANEEKTNPIVPLSNRYGVGDDLGAPEIPTLDEDAIRKQTQEEIQAQLDALDASYVSVFADIEDQRRGGLGSTRAIGSRAGLAGSPMGAAMKDKTNLAYDQIRDAQQAKLNAQKAALFTSARKRANDLIAAKEADIDTATNEWREYKEKMMNDAAVDMEKYIQMGGTVEGLDDTEKDMISEQTGKTIDWWQQMEIFYKPKEEGGVIVDYAMMKDFDFPPSYLGQAVADLPEEDRNKLISSMDKGETITWTMIKDLELPPSYFGKSVDDLPAEYRDKAYKKTVTGTGSSGAKVTQSIAEKYNLPLDSIGKPISSLSEEDRSRVYEDESGDLTPEQQAAQDEANRLKGLLDKKEIDWGYAFETFKEQYPNLSNEQINEALGGSIEYNYETGEFGESSGRAKSRAGVNESQYMQNLKDDGYTGKDILNHYDKQLKFGYVPEFVKNWVKANY